MKPETKKSRRIKREASFNYFSNRKCKYFPCHKMNPDEFNCLFCFCPVYFAICPGTPEYIEKDGSTFKSCIDCEYPHKAENYAAIIECLTSMLNGKDNE